MAFDGKIMNYVNGKFHVVIDVACLEESPCGDTVEIVS